MAHTASPALDALPVRVADRGALITNLVTIELLIVIATQKVAVPLGGEGQIQLALLIHFAFTALHAGYGILQVHAKRLAFYLVLMSAALIVHVLSGVASFSPTSLLLFGAIYINYAFVMRIDRAMYLRILKRFQLIALGVAGLVGFNWLTQFAGLGMPNIETFIPKLMLYNQYNYIQPIHWGSPYTKPNAFFFLETSHTSQFIAFGLIIELCLFQRVRYVGCLAVALLSTFGGTGMTLILLSAPFMLLYLRPVFAISLLVCAPLALVVASGIGLLDNIEKRSTEFSRDGSSANQRFVAPVEVMAEVLTGDPDKAVLGIGAGNMPRALNITWNPMSKVSREYGFVVFGLWFFFMIYCLFGNGVPFIVSWIFFIQYHLLNGSLLVPLHTVYCILAASAYIVSRGETETEAAPAPLRARGATI